MNRMGICLHLCGPLKNLGDKQVLDEDDVQHEVLQQMTQQPKEIYAAGVGALMKRWDTCITTLLGIMWKNNNCFQVIIYHVK
ncbi:hypothetical protein TNIN_140951 [Trichonephila inaurata madagascariensis]|uniref:Uncharacterized protein n=1 Tax=Trichonephila inaurata madagascariensis TaxID=2747483 RepID=A0A8X6Y809_9ARAC|nr:hypothetical protein TNIN_140951 [Trichonephila inaurata madagascariensis]